VVKEIYAYGFRNPHRLSWTQKGYLLASDIGQVNIESIKLVQPGKCYGWPWREGTFLVDPHKDINKIYPLPENDAEFGYTYPLAQYDHDEGRAVIGGFEYTGSAIPELKGKYLFADMNFGRLFFINTADIEPGNMATIYEWRISYEGKLVTTQELCGHSRVDLRVGVDNKGEFYLFSKQDGKVSRLKRVVTEGHLRTTSGPV
jgi:glucose/arabinose dehydrogenase